MGEVEDKKQEMSLYLIMMHSCRVMVLNGSAK